MSSDGKEAFAKELESHGLGRLTPLLAEQDVVSMDDLQGLHDDDVSEFIAELASTKDKLKLGEKAKLRNLVKELRAKAERKKAAEAPAPAPAPVPDEPMMAPQPFPLASPFQVPPTRTLAVDEAAVIRRDAGGVLYGRMGGRRQRRMNPEQDKGRRIGGRRFGDPPISTIQTNLSTINVMSTLLKRSKGMAVKETARRQQTSLLKSQLREIEAKKRLEEEKKAMREALEALKVRQKRLEVEEQQEDEGQGPMGGLGLLD